MIDPFPEYWELVSFFETEAIDENRDVPMIYRGVSFKTESRDGEWVRCSIGRADETMLIEWHRGEAQVLTLKLHWVTQLKIEKSKGREAMILRFKDNNLEELRFFVRPTPSLFWGIKMYPGAYGLD